MYLLCAVKFVAPPSITLPTTPPSPSDLPITKASGFVPSSSKPVKSPLGSSYKSPNCCSETLVVWNVSGLPSTPCVNPPVSTSGAGFNALRATTLDALPPPSVVACAISSPVDTDASPLALTVVSGASSTGFSANASGSGSGPKSSCS